MRGLTDFKAIAFDFDGVLADTRRAHTNARVKAFEFASEVTGDERFGSIQKRIHKEAHTHGNCSAEIIGWVLRKAGITSEVDEQIVQPLVEIKNKIYWKEAQARGLPAMPAALTFIDYVAGQKPERLAIVTSARWEEEVEPFLQRHYLTPYFPPTRVVASRDVINQKPDPEPYLTLIDRMDIESPKLMVIEDSPGGIESAKRAGAFVVGLASTHVREELTDVAEDVSPDIVAQQFEDIIPTLKTV